MIRNRQTIELVPLNAVERHEHPGRELRIHALGFHPAGVLVWDLEQLVSLEPSLRLSVECDGYRVGSSGDEISIIAVGSELDLRVLGAGV